MVRIREKEGDNEVEETRNTKENEKENGGEE